jgi:hypothetical protein
VRPDDDGAVLGAGGVGEQVGRRNALRRPVRGLPLVGELLALGGVAGLLELRLDVVDGRLEPWLARLPVAAVGVGCGLERLEVSGLRDEIRTA